MQNCLLNRLKRFRHSKGFGIHSPFAFGFITNIIYSKYWYYAFDDIECILMQNNIEVDSYKSYHISYRLIQYFKPNNVLQIGASNGVDALYVCYSNIVTCFDCLEDNKNSVYNLEKLFSGLETGVNFLDKIDSSKQYNSIFINIESDAFDINRLFEVSHDDAFWVVSGINSKVGKEYWKSIVKDNRVTVTFDIKNIGIILLNKKYKKQNYLI